MANVRSWSKMTRVYEGGGVHLYIKGEVLRPALGDAGIAVDACHLVMRATYLGECAQGVASLLVEIKESKKR